MSTFESPSASSSLASIHPKHPVEAYYGLLTNPPGRFGLNPSDDTMGVTFRGCSTFIERGYALFSSFGGEVKRKNPNGSIRYERREPVLHVGVQPNTAYLFMPRRRVEMSLRLYLYGQICRVKAHRQVIRDEDETILDIRYLNEAAMMEEASQLTSSFMEHEMASDYGVIEANWKPSGVGGGYSEHHVPDTGVLRRVVENIDWMASNRA